MLGRAFVLVLLLLQVGLADKIFDFGKESKPYKPYENEDLKLTPSLDAKPTSQKPPKAKDSKNLDSKSVADGTHLKGREFFNHYIKGRPKGIVRDFYIWQYLSENNLKADEINEAYKLLNAKNAYLRKVLNNLGRNEKLPRDLECVKMNLKAALKQDAACLGISVRNRLPAFKTLPKKEVDAILAKLPPKGFKDTARAIRVLNSSGRTSDLFKENAIVFAMVYNALSYEEKLKITTPTPNEDLNRLSREKTVGFANILNNIVLDSKLDSLRGLLLDSDLTNLPHNTLFLLGINELRFGSKQKALAYFKRAEAATKNVFFVDRALFWQYLVSKDKSYLKKLLKSKNANIFSIYASQKLKAKPGFVIVNKLPSLSLENPPFDTLDPYVWQNIATTMIGTSDPVKLAKTLPYFSYKQTQPQLAFVMQKIDKYANNYYITPYEGLVKWDSPEEQSFVFSIARQESYFIPTLISRSFALGLMQIMPANVKPFAKEMGLKDIDYNDLFDPKVALEMGRHFIRQLKKEYKNPLFVGYAYNGGPGFLRRLLAKNELFLKNRDYEPWLSMELIPYEESRFYGMKIVANFIIYEELFGRTIDLESLLNKTLIYSNPKITN